MTETLDRIRSIRDERERVEAERVKRNAELAKLMRSAREAGATWPAIAEAAGMTRQGVRWFLQQHENGSGSTR